MHHILSIADINRQQLLSLIDIAEKMQPVARGTRIYQPLNGKICACLFLEPSTRTRLSFNSAFLRLGGDIIEAVSAEVTSLNKGESLKDTGRVLSGYCDVIVTRTQKAGDVAHIAQAARVPVINAGDGDGEHPTQALLDLYTIVQYLGDVERLRDESITLAFVGDLCYGRTVHSLATLLCRHSKIKLRLISPPSLGMPQWIIDTLNQHHCVFEQFHSLQEGLGGSDIVYCTRFQRERHYRDIDIDKIATPFFITDEIVEQLCPDALLLHPLPRDSQWPHPELHIEREDHNLGIFRQSDNGVPVRMAIFAHLFDLPPPPAA